MESPASRSKPKSTSKSTMIIAVLLIMLVIPLIFGVGFMQNCNQMSPHQQSFFRAMGTDFITGHWNFNQTKETAQRNGEESKKQTEASYKRLDTAEKEYQKALKQSQQEYDAAMAAKRKPKEKTR